MAKKWHVHYATMRHDGIEIVAAENQADAIGRVYLKYGYKGGNPMMLKILAVLPLLKFRIKERNAGKKERTRQR